MTNHEAWYDPDGPVPSLHLQVEGIFTSELLIDAAVEAANALEAPHIIPGTYKKGIEGSASKEVSDAMLARLEPPADADEFTLVYYYGHVLRLPVEEFTYSPYQKNLHDPVHGEERAKRIPPEMLPLNYVNIRRQLITPQTTTGIGRTSLKTFLPKYPDPNSQN